MIPYAEKLKDPRWQQKRLRIMERDGWRCRHCANTGRNLQVHHTMYAKEPWSIDDEFLLTLCDDCHEELHENEKGARHALGMILARSTRFSGAKLARDLATIADEMVKSGSCVPEYELTLKGCFQHMAETRWTEAAHIWPAARPIVEAVIGRKIAWRAAI